MHKETIASRCVDTSPPVCYNAFAMSHKSNRTYACKVPEVPKIEIIGVTGIPEVKHGDEIGVILTEAAKRQNTVIQSNDIVVITQKIVSKSEGRIVDLRKISPSNFATQLAQHSNRDPRLVELILRESRAIIRMDLARGIFITETQHGFICANAGIDTSNVPGDHMVSLLPKDPDKAAQRIRSQLHQRIPGGSIAVVISDTFGRPWREGHINFAIGVAGMDSIHDYRGSEDAYGTTLKTTQIASADELAAAAELVMGKVRQVPIAIVQGYKYVVGSNGAQTLLRHRSTDLFR